MLYDSSRRGNRSLTQRNTKKVLDQIFMLVFLKIGFIIFSLQR